MPAAPLNSPVMRQIYNEVAFTWDFLLHLPEEIDPGTLLIVGLHGYGSTPEAMLRLTVPAVGSRHVIAALRAPNQHYASQPGPNAVAAYNWGIQPHWEESVRLHHRMVQQVLDHTARELGLGPDKAVLMGFSQPVGLNYRFVATYPGKVRGVIGICGGIPRDWDEPKYHPVDASILHISRDADEFYPVERANQFPDQLRRRASDVEFHMIPGAHRFPSKASAIIQPWLERVFGTPPTVK